MRPERKGAGEGADIKVPGVIGGAAVVVAAIVFALALTRVFLAALGAGIHDPSRAPRELPPAPREQLHPLADYQHYRADEQSRLGSYAWVDRQAGIVQIPVERAMSLLVKDDTQAAAESERR
jgi:hypothetical protein